MPVQFLTTAERDRLNRFPSETSYDDLIAFFTLSERDIEQIPVTSAQYNRLGFALQLGMLRYLGFCPDTFHHIPQNVVAYVADQLDIAPQAMELYGRQTHTRTGHFKDIQQYLGFRKATEKDLQKLADWLKDRALEHNRPSLLFQLACERVYADKIVRPGVTIIERMVGTARQEAQTEIFQRVSSLLTQECRAKLDQLLLPDKTSKRTPLTWLRRGARSHSANEILAVLDKVAFLREIGVEGWDLSVINPNRLKFLARIGRKATNRYLQRSIEERRYPILLAFLHESLLDITDELLDVYDQCLWEIDRKARKDLKDFQQRMFQSLNNRLITLKKLAGIIVDQDIKTGSPRTQIYTHVASREALCHLIEETEQMIRPEDGGHLDFFNKRYSYIRQFAPKFLKALTFHSTSSLSVLKAVDLLRRLDQESQRAVPQDAPRTFIPKKWKTSIFTNGTINRRYYELCALWELRNALRSGDVWLENSRRYATLDSYLIPTDKWPALQPEVCRQISLPEKGIERVEEREKEVANLFSRVEQVISSNDTIRVEDQRIIVSRFESEKRPESAVLLEQRISQRLPQIDLADLLIEVDSWVSFSECFTHAAGGEGKRDHHFLQPLYACVVAQAENFGLEQMSHISEISYERLAWCNHWYLREETIKAAFTRAVNYHHQLPLSQYWGSGMFSSSDGQRFPVAGKFRHAAPLPKYFGYGRGVTFYTWSSDQLSQYGTKFVTSTLRDATYVLDEILDNETDLEILEHTTDTAGYTEVIFALFDLLGLQFSPRIRDLHEQQLWRPASVDMTRYPIFRERVKGVVHRDFIIKHWDYMLRLVGSLKLGWVTASLFIQKLQAYPRKHLLMKLLQEYGKLVKTRFILKWYEDEAYRRRINTQLNKGEALHGLRAYIHVANKGYIRKREPEALTNQVNCLNLMTNAVIIWNTVYMQAAIDQLKQEGEQIEGNDIRHIWPTRYEHINVHGKYHFNVDENLSRKGLRPLRQ